MKLVLVRDFLFSCQRYSDCGRQGGEMRGISVLVCLFLLQMSMALNPLLVPVKAEGKVCDILRAFLRGWSCSPSFAQF